MPYRDDVQCSVQELAYDFEARRGRLVLGPQSCTDMGGYIALFKKIDPSVSLIETFQGEKPDTRYRLVPGGDWQAPTWQAFLPGEA